MNKDISPYEAMQAAVDIVSTSPHPTNKIAAALVCADGSRVVRTNLWPAQILKAFGTDGRIGNASGTLHAETACILAAPSATENATMFLTDPPCPNCMKNMAEAGIQSLYIDHKGFDKDFAKRRGSDFENMSMRIAERAGLNVFIVRRKQGTLSPILEIPHGYTPVNEFPLMVEHDERLDPQAFVRAQSEIYKNSPFAAAQALDSDKKLWLSACAHAVIGYSQETVESPDGKYSFVLEPINRLIMGAARHKYTLAPKSLYSSRVPTARELINMTGAGFLSIRIGNMNSARDIFGPMALKQLTDAKIMTVLEA